MKEFIKPTFKKINTKEISPNRDEFVISPLSQGFGNTMGNSLRRVMISNIQGLAPFAIEIKGVIHEFSTMTGVIEDTVQLILNLKDLNLKFDPELISDDDEESAIELKLVSSKGEVLAKEIVAPKGIEIVNPKLVIANTTKDKALDMTIFCTIGKGFESFENNRQLIITKLKNKKGVIAMDSLFSPVVSSAMDVSKYKPGTNSNFEKLTLTVETNGAKTPESVVIDSAKFLNAHFNKVMEIYEEPPMEEEMFVEEKITTEKDLKLMKSIIDLNLSVRSYNALKRMDIESIKELTSKTLEEVKNTKNLGKKSLEEVIDRVHDFGFKFKDEE